jgi:uncharacterized membrane protein
MIVADGVLLAAALTSGLNAGLFATFGYAVLPGLRRTDDAVFVAAMRQINRAILNGWFVIVFVGAPLLTIVALILRPGPALIVAVVAHLATLLLTGTVNVPLNNRLDRADPGEASGTRAIFERRWVRSNVVRAVTSLLAAAATLVALSS